jgi:hypothetical protein
MFPNLVALFPQQVRENNAQIYIDCFCFRYIPQTTLVTRCAN